MLVKFVLIKMFDALTTDISLYKIKVFILLGVDHLTSLVSHQISPLF